MGCNLSLQPTARSKSSNAVQSCIGTKVTNFSERSQESILTDTENAHDTRSGVQAVEELAVHCNRDVEVRTAWWQGSENRPCQWSKRTIRGDAEARDGGRSCIRCVDESAIGSHRQPAGCRSESWHTGANGRERQIGEDCVGRNRRRIISACRPGLCDERCSIWRVSAGAL